MPIVKFHHDELWHSANVLELSPTLKLFAWCFEFDSEVPPWRIARLVGSLFLLPTPSAQPFLIYGGDPGQRLAMLVTFDEPLNALPHSAALLVDRGLKFTVPAVAPWLSAPQEFHLSPDPKHTEHP